MATFVLISGAWHAGWCWERVVPLLSDAGHRVLAPDLLGTGLDRTPLAHVTLAQWADQIADVVRSEPEPVILIGHSRGGIVISEAAERVPERVRSLVYIAAGLVPNGDSLLAVSNRFVPDFGLDMVTIHSDGTYTVNPDQVRPRLYNKTDPTWIARAEARLQADPANTLTETVHLSAERFGSVPRAYIETTEDRTVFVELQRAMRNDMPCDPVLTLNSDHCAFYSDPQALTRSLLSIASSARSAPDGWAKAHR